METKKNQVTARSGGKPYTTEVVSGKHTFVADEPDYMGGADLGPKSHDLLLGSLAACACITIRMYALRKGWNLKSVQAEVMMKRTVENGVQSTHVLEEFTFEGNLDAEMKSRLVEIAKRCPVHKTLSPAMEITMHEKA